MSDRVPSHLREHHRKPSGANHTRHRGASGTAWTLGHGARQVRLGPITFWTIAGALVLMTAWSLGTASYFAVRGDLLTRLISRQAQMLYGYEERIADLRGQVDRLASRQLLDQEQYEQKLEQLVRREALLESRATALSGLPDHTATGSIRPTNRPQITGDKPTPTLKPSPINDTVILTAPREREARLDIRGAGLEATLARLESALDRVEARQHSTLATLEENYDAKAKQIRRVLGDLGLALGKLPLAAPRAMGGPFVPAKMTPETAAFEHQLLRISTARGQVERLARALAAVPVRKPVPGEVDTTSGFGMRVDPFLH